MKTGEQKRYKFIGCEIIYREICLLAAESRHIVDVEFLRKGLHDAGKEKMLETIQQTVSAVETEDYDAILLGYAWCSDGLVGLAADDLPMVIPRAHDCITFFFGSDGAYQEYFGAHPGTYFRTTGWTERAGHDGDSVMAQLGLDRSFEEYVAKYGRENAEFIMESIGGWTREYEVLAYIEMGLLPDAEYMERAREEAKEKELEFRLLKGDMGLMRDLVEGNWDAERFLVVRPGERIAADHEGLIMTVVSSGKGGD